ncbi:MAG: hypothetical protein RL538_530 [Candidatus Parcubacteria bacterium]|jgi:Tfp pilus assembly protein PilV
MEIIKEKQNGFALLLTLIVVGVVVSIGVALLDLSLKQVRLSTNAKDSEIAFHAANAGMECARYIRRIEAADMEEGDPISGSCFGRAFTVSLTSSNVDRSYKIPDGDITSGSGEAFVYDYQITWTGNQRCSQITTLVASSTWQSSGADMVINNMTTHVPGYPDGSTKTCENGNRCTVLSVRGYNKPCSDVGDYGVIQREVLLQF